MSITVNSLEDLYALYGASDFDSLNRRIYKATECGACVSIYGTLPAAEASEEQRKRAQERYTARLFEDKHMELVPVLTEAYRDASAEEKERIGQAETAFLLEGDRDPFVAWAHTVCPGAFDGCESDVLERVPVTYHNGNRTPIPPSFVLEGFSIHSIVEGSDATVDSPVFPPGTTEDEVDNWVSYMEDEVDRLRQEANEYDDENG